MLMRHADWRIAPHVAHAAGMRCNEHRDGHGREQAHAQRQRNDHAYDTTHKRPGYCTKNKPVAAFLPAIYFGLEERHRLCSLPGIPSHALEVEPSFPLVLASLPSILCAAFQLAIQGP